MLIFTVFLDREDISAYSLTLKSSVVISMEALNYLAGGHGVLYLWVTVENCFHFSLAVSVIWQGSLTKQVHNYILDVYDSQTYLLFIRSIFTYFSRHLNTIQIAF